MHPVFLRAAGFESLIRAKGHGLPYRFDTIFSDASWGKRRASRRKFQLLRRIDNKLREMLHPGEEVRSLTRGLCFEFWESYFLGWLLGFIDLRAIVFTDRRILLLQIDRRGRPKTLRSQIRYPTIAKAGWAFLTGTKVTFRDGEALYLSGLPRKDRKRIREVVDRLRQIDLGEVSRAGGKEELCPYCSAVVALGTARCDRCAGKFKSAKRAGLLSLLFPGLGDYYMGHRTLAVAEMLFALAVWVIVFLPDLPLLDSALPGAALPDGVLPDGVLPDGVLPAAAPPARTTPVTALPDPARSMAPVVALVTVLIVLMLVHVPGGAVTWYLARLGIYPAEDASSGRIRRPPVPSRLSFPGDPRTTRPSPPRPAPGPRRH